MDELTSDRNAAAGTNGPAHASRAPGDLFEGRMAGRCVVRRG
jgi:hypothetical protein